MSDSVRPHGLQPTRLLHPWDFPGKSTGVGCHCLLRARWLSGGQFTEPQKCLQQCKQPPPPCSSVQFSRSVVFNSLRSHESQHTRPPCPSPTPGVHPNSCASSWCLPLLLPPSIFSNIRVFSNESVLHIRWPKYWSFSFGISHSNEYSGLISFRID